MNRRQWILACLVLGVGACGPNKKPGPGCGQVPDFDVVVHPTSGVLPSDTRLLLKYGSGEETYELDSPMTPEVMFCKWADANGTPIEAGAPGAGTSAGGNGGSGSAGASSSEEPDASAPISTPGVAALNCTLWTQGPATLIVTASGYPALTADLNLVHDTCTVAKDIELIPLQDGGT